MRQTRRCSSRRICFAVNRSTTRIVPPQPGHCGRVVSHAAGGTVGLAGGIVPSRARQSGSRVWRRRLANHPK
jgi:hypothetical protein